MIVDWQQSIFITLHTLHQSSIMAMKFMYLVKNKELTIEYIYNIKYHFLQISEWLFTVEHIERKGYNVGWLITSFSKLNSKEKIKFKNNLLYKLDK